MRFRDYLHHYFAVLQVVDAKGVGPGSPWTRALVGLHRKLLELLPKAEVLQVLGGQLARSALGQLEPNQPYDASLSSVFCKTRSSSTDYSLESAVQVTHLPGRKVGNLRSPGSDFASPSSLLVTKLFGVNLIDRKFRPVLRACSLRCSCPRICQTFGPVCA